MVDLTRPRWWEGVARILDLGLTFNEPYVPLSPEEARDRPLQPVDGTRLIGWPALRRRHGRSGPDR